MTDFAIEAKNIKKKFGGKNIGPFKKPIVKALQGVNLNIKYGENYCLLGPNGSGKTTLIRSLLGLLEAEGFIKILGYEIPKERQKIMTKIGYMPQDISLYPDLSVKETLHFFGRIYGLKNRQVRNQAVEELLEIFILKRWQNIIVANLSGGMKRRLSLASSLIHKPMLVFLDEPTIGVDPTLRLSFWDYFKDLNEQGTTIITTTHIMDEAEKSKIIGFLRNGRLIAEGTVNGLRKKVPGNRKLIIGTSIENTQPIADLIAKEYELNVLPSNYKIEVFYNNDSLMDTILMFIREKVKIREIQTVEPSLEDTFIYFSKKSEVSAIK
ncbi:MAG: ATP-binding cassette domain-containing protein [Promethearchaeota archaeon]